MNTKKILIIGALVAVAAFAYGAREGLSPLSGTILGGSEACELKKEACAVKKEACKTCEAGEDCEKCDAKKAAAEVKSGACCDKK